MTLLKSVEAGIAFCLLSGIGAWALAKWSKTEESESFMPTESIELDDYEEAIGGDLHIAPSQYN